MLQKSATEMRCRGDRQRDIQRDRQRDKERERVREAIEMKRHK